MRSFKMIALLFVLSLITSASVTAATKEYIEVYGWGSAIAKADIAKIKYTVEGFGSKLAKAFSDARQKVSEISKQLIQLGIKENDLETSTFYTGENYSKSFLSSAKDYRAVLSVFVTINDFKLVEPAILKISENNIKSISQAEFSVKDKSELYDRAKSKAVADAKRKAQDIAKDLGVKLGNALYAVEVPLKEDVTEKYGRLLRSQRSYLADGGGLPEAPQGIFPDKVEIESEMKVGFEIIQINR